VLQSYHILSPTSKFASSAVPFPVQTAELSNHLNSAWIVPRVLKLWRGITCPLGEGEVERVNLCLALKNESWHLDNPPLPASPLSFHSQSFLLLDCPGIRHPSHYRGTYNLTILPAILEITHWTYSYVTSLDFISWTMSLYTSVFIIAAYLITAYYPDAPTPINNSSFSGKHFFRFLFFSLYATVSVAVCLWGGLHTFLALRACSLLHWTAGLINSGLLDS
jgi:hypothetical protein